MSSFIVSDNRFFDTILQLRQDNLKLSVENEKIRTGGAGSGQSSTGGGDSSIKVQTLEKKLMAQQEELTDLHKRKGENSQLIVDLNVKVAEVTKQLLDKEQQLNEQVSKNNSLRAENHMLAKNESELKGLNDVLRDEYTALQLAFTALEEKLRKAQEENQKMENLIIKYKERVAEKLNEENDMMQRYSSFKSKMKKKFFS